MTPIMFLDWLRLWPADILSTLACWLLAPFVVPFAADGHLPPAFWWMETPDNSLDGDNGWKTEHWQWRYSLPDPLANYVGRVGWLWRNPAYAFALDVLGAPIPLGAVATITGDIKTSDNPGHAGHLFIRVGDYWEYYLVIPYGSTGRCLRARFGWKLKDYAEAVARGEQLSTVAMYAIYANPLKGFDIVK